MKTMKRLAISVLLIVLAIPNSTRAKPTQTVVGDGTAASCTEAALAAALAAGGLITFNCGGDATIIFSNHKTIANTVVLDGGNRITLSANGSRHFDVPASGQLTLRNITVQNGFVNGDGGSIRNNGTMVIEESLFISNTATRGGAIFNGPASSLVMTRTLLEANQANSGAGVYGQQAGLRINNSILKENVAVSSGGGIDNWGGEVHVEGSLITGNRSSKFAEGVGGGVNNWFVFVGNTPFIGTLVMTDTTLTQNYASKRGGGLHNAGAATLQRVTIDHNTSQNGGGIYNTINDSTHSLLIRNSTISNNSVGSEAGGLYQEQGKLDIAFSTFANNNSDIGGAIVIGSGQTSNTQAKAVIFASSGCSGGALQSAGFNLETGNTCGLNQSTDRPNTNPQLGELADNGGPTQTRMPALNSPANDAGGTSCDAVDQRGEAHPIGTACDVGAVEITPPSLPVCGGEFGAIQDATLSATAPNLTQGSATTLLLNNTGGKRDVALIGFDLSTLPPLTEVHISKAVLQLSVALTQSLPVTNLLDVCAVGAPWSESVVWNTQPVSRPSYANGGSLLSGGTRIEIDVTTLAMQWHSGAITQTSVLVLPGAPGTNVQVSAREGQAAPKLSIECATLPREVPINPAQRTDRQEQAITQLRNSSVVSPSVQFENGALVHATFEITSPSGVVTDALASWFLTTYNDLLGVTVPTDTWQLVRRSPDGQHIFFRQLHAGLPVFPTEIGVHLSNKKVMGFSGDYVPEITVSPTPILSATQAEHIALNASAPGGEVLGKTQLRYINLALIDPAASPQTQLAWRVHTSASEGLYVDAYTGAVLLAGEFTAQDFDLDLETANGTGPSDTCWAFTYDDDQWFDENGPLRGKNPSQEGSTAFENITDIYVWWRYHFGRDSYDNDGEDIQMYVHVDDPPAWGVGKYPGAHYNSGCDIFEYASGIPKNDIMMHEFVHGIVHSEYNPVYAFQPGAINESLADTFAAFFDGNWTIGESVTVTASPLRSMSNPPSIPSPTSPAPYPPYPDRMSQILTTFIGVDNGAVHFNSSILNKASFLITAGQMLTVPFNGHTVRGIGTPKAMRLYHNVMVNRLTKSSQFIDMARAMVAEARSLRDIGFFSTADVCSVIEGFAAVELGPPDSDCNGVEDNAPNGGDFDKDGVPDTLPGPGGAPWDNCREDKNPTQENFDGDKLGDACDTDDDNDLVSDFDDNCHFVYNPDQSNRDKDKLGDACDTDADGDDVRDTIDNCPFVANRRQEDADLDHVGDACDMDSDSDLICDFGGPRASGPGIRPWSGGCAKGRGSYLDERSPGLSFRAGDNCRLVPNQGQEDGDVDSVGDACDICPGKQGVDNGDSDGDGQGNACDEDDDDDGVKDYKPDGSPLDNCREVKNPDQTNRNGNDKGFACDPEEQRAYLLSKNLKVQVQFDRDSIVPVPIDNCPSCGLGVLPSNLKTTVVVNVPVGVKARIVDSEGFVVAKSTGTGNAHVFTFSSKPFAGYSFRSGGFSSFRKQSPTLQTAEGPYSYLSDADVGYTLQLVPGKDVDLTKSYEVTVGITTEAKRNKVFLPLARK